jgi:hypothetical protein
MNEIAVQASDRAPARARSVARMVFVPSLVTLAVTIVRLVGESERWSRLLFNPDAGGPLAIVGIVWLAPIFGIVFALELSREEGSPTRLGRAWLAIAAGVVLAVFGVFGAAALHLPVPAVEALGFGLLIVATLIVLSVWRRLFLVLLAYGLAARVPVAILMYFAMRGRWGTHYDALPPGAADSGFWMNYLVYALVPQLVMWVAFTIVAGALAGIPAAAFARRRAVVPSAPAS